MISSHVEIPTTGSVSRAAKVQCGKTDAAQQSSLDGVLQTLAQTNSLPAGETKGHLRETTYQLQYNLHLGTSTAGQMAALAFGNSKTSKRTTSNVTSVNMYIKGLEASNVQNHGAAEDKTDIDNLATRPGQFSTGYVKFNIHEILAKMSQSIAFETSTGVGATFGNYGLLAPAPNRMLPTHFGISIRPSKVTLFGLPWPASRLTPHNLQRSCA